MIIICCHANIDWKFYIIIFRFIVIYIRFIIDSYIYKSLFIFKINATLDLLFVHFHKITFFSFLLLYNNYQILIKKLTKKNIFVIIQI